MWVYTESTRRLIHTERSKDGGRIAVSMGGAGEMSDKTEDAERAVWRTGAGEGR